MPPICMPMEPRLAKPQRAKVAIEKVRGVRVALSCAELGEGDELVEDGAGAEEVADGRGVVPGDADEPGDGGAEDAEDRVEGVREGDVTVRPEDVRDAEHDGVDEADEGEEADEHDGDVEGELAAVDSAAGDGGEEVFVVVLFAGGHVDDAGGGWGSRSRARAFWRRGWFRGRS